MIFPKLFPEELLGFSNSGRVVDYGQREADWIEAGEQLIFRGPEILISRKIVSV